MFLDQNAYLGVPTVSSVYFVRVPSVYLVLLVLILHFFMLSRLLLSSTRCRVDQ